MHHANLLIGSRKWGLSQIPEAERTPGVDVIFFDDEHMSVKDARDLSHEANLRPVMRTHRTFIIACETFLHEAQNALLKTLEEPNPETLFYIIVPREDLLLPTLRSRLHLLASERRADTQEVFMSFLDSSYAERLRTIMDRLAAEDDAWASELMRGLEAYAVSNKDPELMRLALDTETYLRAHGSSKKMLLEHVALSL